MNNGRARKKREVEKKQVEQKDTRLCSEFVKVRLTPEICMITKYYHKLKKKLKFGVAFENKIKRILKNLGRVKC